MSDDTEQVMRICQNETPSARDAAASDGPEAVQLHLRVYADRSELVRPDGTVEVFHEGPQSEGARERSRTISAALAVENGNFLEKQILLCRDEPGAVEANLDLLRDSHRRLLNALVVAVTSEVGRALVALSVLQLCIKAVEPQQSVRLHKGRSAGGRSVRLPRKPTGSAAGEDAEEKQDLFSWVEGVAMRTAIDRPSITPILRKYDLIRLNRDGVFMTRSLAENYPYTEVYKAGTRGARRQWMEMIELLEAGKMPPLAALQYLLSQLLNNASEFKALVSSSTDLLGRLQSSGRLVDRPSITALLKRHIYEADYSARVMEVAMHSLMQALQEVEALDGRLIPLSQMRSANKKHGNVADIELQVDGDIVEAWDAKFGKPDLREELEELNEKLSGHGSVDQAGFVTSETPEHLEKVKFRVEQIEDLHGVVISILTLEDWVSVQFDRASKVAAASEAELAIRWVRAYAESLGRRRPDLAPIDEPCHAWMASLYSLLSELEAAEGTA